MEPLRQSPIKMVQFFIAVRIVTLNFFEPEPNKEYRGPVFFYELVASSCRAGFFPQDLALFEP